MRCYFYPRPPRGGRPTLGYIKTLADVFLSTPSARRATFIAVVKTRCFYYFYPRPPRGGRPRVSRAWCVFVDFYPRPPRGGRRSGCKLLVCWCHISIHALREEGDADIFQRGLAGVISIHALREEGDKHRYGMAADWRIFLSTPSARRATSSQ